jgi:hypothetical protein
MRRRYPVKKDGLLIDSGETENLHCEFIIPQAITFVIIYLMIWLDSKNKDIGWDITTFYDLL